MWSHCFQYCPQKHQAMGMGISQPISEQWGVRVHGTQSGRLVHHPARKVIGPSEALKSQYSYLDNNGNYFQ